MTVTQGHYSGQGPEGIIPEKDIRTEAGAFFIGQKWKARHLLRECPWPTAGGKLKKIFLEAPGLPTRQGYCIVFPGGLMYSVDDKGAIFAWRAPRKKEENVPG